MGMDAMWRVASCFSLLFLLVTKTVGYENSFLSLLENLHLYVPEDLFFSLMLLLCPFLFFFEEAEFVQFMAFAFWLHAFWLHTFWTSSPWPG